MSRCRWPLLASLLAWLAIPSSVPAQSGIRYVHPSDPACGGQSPCYTSIQAAVNAAKAGEHVVLQAGTYVEQVSVTGKNSMAAATQADRIVIEADPAAAPGRVVLQGAVDQCPNGHAIRLQQSRFITIRGLTITGAGGAAIALMGGNNRNEAIHLERLRIYGNGGASCDGGVTIARGNPGTLLLNSLVYGNGRNGLATLDADGGPHYVIGNTFHANQWSGLSITRAHEVFLINNAITGNGTAPGSTGGRAGVWRESSTSPQPAGIHLLHNLICGNRLGEVGGPALDPSDGGNLTPTGAEGAGVTASAGCDAASTVYGDVDGADGVPGTADDDFRLAGGSPALDHGMDPRALGLDAAVIPLLETDFTGVAGTRPTNATGAPSARFDIGAFEANAVDDTAPAVTITAPPPSAHVSGAVPITAQATDPGGGVASLTLHVGAERLTTALTPSLPPPAAAVAGAATWNTTAFADGAHTVTAEARDVAGNPGSATRVLIADNTPPDTSIVDGPDGAIRATTATFSVTGLDNLTPVGSLVFAWRLDDGGWSVFSATTAIGFDGLAEGPHTFEVKARDLAGNEDLSPASRRFTVQLGPTITGLDPGSGPVGTFVTITGDSFLPGTTTVTFGGAAAALRTVTATRITTTVPPGATTGALVVTTGRGAPAATAFTVTLTGDFGVAAAPATVRAIAGDRASVAVTANGTGAFTHVVNLTIAGPMTDITAALESVYLAPGGGTTLTLTVPASVGAGTYLFTIVGTATIDGQSVARQTSISLEVLGAGTNAVTGRIMTAEPIPQPIPGASVALGTAFVLTDAAGNFVLLGPPPGAAMLFVDGRTASTPSAQFPIVEVQLDVAASGVTRVPFTVFLPILDTANAVTLPLDNGVVTQDTIVTTPRIPGLAIRIPAQTTITGPDGNPVSQLVITPVPVDRSPMPLPPGIVPPVLFAINPGTSVPSRPLPITFPNAARAEPGAKADLYYFDLTIGTWSIWGTGTVTADGSQIASDPGYGLPRLAWHFAYAATSEQVRERHATGGDPVDLVTGRFTVDRADLVLPGRIPITIRRLYHSEDATSGLFGVGWNLAPYDTLIAQAGAGPSLNLIRSDQSSYLFRQSGSEWIHSGEPDLAGAVLTALPGEFNFQLRYKDGTVHRFRKISGFVAAALVAIEDGNGNVLTIQRSTALFDRRILSITEPAGRQIVFAYDAAGRIAEIADPLGRTVRYAYDDLGRLEVVTDPAGGVTRYGYDGSNPRIATVTDPRGILFLTNEYDGNGRVVRQTQADGSVWRFSYVVPAPALPSGEGCPQPPCATATPASAETSVTDPLGHLTRYRFSPSEVFGAAAGFTSDITNALNQTTRLDLHGVPVLDALERRTQTQYDLARNLIRLIDPAGGERTYTYEPTRNRLTSVTDPLGHVTTFDYDTLGNLTGIVDPRGQRTSVAYDPLGQPTAITDAVGNRTALGYDAAGNLTTMTDPLGQTTTRQYDTVGRLVRQTDPRGKATAFAYDALNRLTTIADAQGGVTRLTYDPNGNLLSVTDARGGRTTYVYDSMDRLVSRTDPVGAAETFEYDLAGNLIRHRDRKGQVATFTYDGLNRRIGAVYADSVATLQYDAAGRVVRIEDSAGGTLSYAYDALDRLVGEAGPLGTVAYAYDAAGRRTRMSPPGASPVTYSHDAASRLTSIIQPPLAPATLQYDDAGRRTRLVLPGQISTEYRYDAASRVTALIYRTAAGVLGDLTYQYDVAGNRVGTGGSFARTLLPSAVDAATYDAANRQLAFGPAVMGYDANGSLVTLADPDGVTHLGWDARNRLVTLAAPAATAAFVYDAAGRRAARHTELDVTAYLYDGLDVVDELSGSSALSYVRTPAIDEPLSRGTDAFYLADALGSVMALVSADGTLDTSYTYAPFGEAVADGPSENTRTFTGREDDGTGVYYYRARYYHPRLQRFLSEDPLGLAGRDSNVYAYVLGNPLRFIDPFGLDVFVRRYCCHPPNTYGHVGIAVGSRLSKGFYPREDSFTLLLDAPVAGRVVPDSELWRADQVRETIMIPTTADQDRAIQSFLDQLERQPGQYRLYGRNCSFAVQQALRAGGINLGLPTPYPETAMARIRKYLESIAPQ